MSPDERIHELEVRLAFQNHEIASLDEVVREFAARVERLERKLADLLAGNAETKRDLAEAEKPPHY